jgi:hypothetical protein
VSACGESMIKALGGDRDDAGVDEENEGDDDNAGEDFEADAEADSEVVAEVEAEAENPDTAAATIGAIGLTENTHPSSSS